MSGNTRTCLLCEEPGRLLYRDVRDRLFEAEGSGSLYGCDACGLAWLDPQPDSLSGAYRGYFTHDAEAESGPLRALKLGVATERFGYTGRASGHRFLYRCLGTLPPVRDAAELAVMGLRGGTPGRSSRDDRQWITTDCHRTLRIHDRHSRIRQA